MDLSEDDANKMHDNKTISEFISMHKPLKIKSNHPTQRSEDWQDEGNYLRRYENFMRNFNGKGSQRPASQHNEKSPS